jgi:hypothetical protein
MFKVELYMRHMSKKCVYFWTWLFLVELFMKANPVKYVKDLK